MKDASVAASLKSYREACSSSLGLSANTFIYSAIAVDYGREGQGSLQVVVAASNDSLIWTECVIRHGQTSMTKKNQIQNAHKGITCLRPLTSFFAPSPTAATLMTAGRDGLVKLWTATSGTSIIDFQTR